MHYYNMNIHNSGAQKKKNWAQNSWVISWIEHRPDNNGTHTGNRKNKNRIHRWRSFASETNIHWSKNAAHFGKILFSVCSLFRFAVRFFFGRSFFFFRCIILRFVCLNAGRVCLDIACARYFFFFAVVDSHIYLFLRRSLRWPSNMCTLLSSGRFHTSLV